MPSNLPNLNAQVDPDPVNTALQSLVGPTMNFLRDELQRSKLALNNYSTSIAVHVKYDLPYINDYVDAMAGALMRCSEVGGNITPNLWALRQEKPRLEFNIDLGSTVSQHSYSPVRNLAMFSINSDFVFDEFIHLAVVEGYGPAKYIHRLIIDRVADVYPDEVESIRLILHDHDADV